MIATHRFLLIIAPPPGAADEVMRIRETLHTHIGGFSGRRVVPHITLFFADLSKHFEALLVDRIEAGAAVGVPFTLQYSGITHFPDRRTIYIDPLEKDAIAAIRGSIVRSTTSDAHLRDHIRETDHPHLTIAAGLKQKQFDEAWRLLAPHAFNAAQIVDAVVLMHRELKPGALYEVIRTFPLAPV